MEWRLSEKSEKLVVMVLLLLLVKMVLFMLLVKMVLSMLLVKMVLQYVIGEDGAAVHVIRRELLPEISRELRCRDLELISLFDFFDITLYERHNI